jgi:hypothetical protein
MGAACRERAWKLKQAKRYAGAAKRSNLDVESRAVVRAREAEAAIRRKAAWIAKEARGVPSLLRHAPLAGAPCLMAAHAEGRASQPGGSAAHACCRHAPTAHSYQAWGHAAPDGKLARQNRFFPTTFSGNRADALEEAKCVAHIRALPASY